MSGDEASIQMCPHLYQARKTRRALEGLRYIYFISLANAVVRQQRFAFEFVVLSHSPTPLILCLFISRNKYMFFNPAA